MKKIVFALCAMIVGISANAVAGGLMAAAVGLPAVGGAVAMNAVSAVAGACGFAPKGSAMAGLFTEAWTGHMVKAFRDTTESLGWYSKIPDFSQYAENDVIHFVNIGGDPTVLVNNTTYPLDIESLDDADKAISLDKYQTKPTRITDDEMYALSYDKKKTVIERHKAVMEEKKYERAIHSLAPAGDTDATPVLLTTGDAVDGRLKLTRKDIIALKKAWDKAKIPQANRILVLCPDHVADLLEDDQKFAQQYYNYTSGSISNLYGFEVYEYVSCPYYTVSTKVKLVYGAAVDTDTDTQASVAFSPSRTMRANGSTKAYASEAKDNPTTQENLVNFRHYSIALPLKNEALSAVVSAFAPTESTTEDETQQ